MSHLGCSFPRRTVQKDGNPWRYLLRIKEGKPLVSDASATNAVHHSVRGDLLRPANWHLEPRRARRIAVVLPILPCRHKENHTSVPNLDVVTAELCYQEHFDKAQAVFEANVRNTASIMASATSVASG